MHQRVAILMHHQIVSKDDRVFQLIRVNLTLHTSQEPLSISAVIIGSTLEIKFPLSQACEFRTLEMQDEIFLLNVM